MRSPRMTSQAVAALFLVLLSCLHVGAGDLRQKIEGDMVGYVDSRTGEFVIKPQFGRLSGLFSEGLAAVELGRRWGFISTNGAFVIGPQSEWNLPGQFSGGLARVYAAGGRSFFIDKTGAVAIPPHLHRSYIYPFSEGLAPFSIREREDARWGYIDTNGNVALEAKFDSVDKFKNGKAKVIVGGKRGVIDRTGEYVQPPEFPPEAEYTYTAVRGGKGLGRISHKGETRDFVSWEQMEAYIATIPKGATLRWIGLDDIGNENDRQWNLKSSHFRIICEKRGVVFDVVPGG